MQEKINPTLEEIHAMSEEDLKLQEDLLFESVRTSALFSKYNKLLSYSNLHYHQLLSKMKVLSREKRSYYNGDADPEEYKSKPFGLKLRKSNVEEYITTDEEVLIHQAKIALQKEKVSALERILKHINDRQWIIRNALEEKKFNAGA